MTSGRNEKEFTKVFNICDILVIAFGAMIGWGWVVSAGDWIRTGGVLGAVLGFAAGGIAIFFVGLACAELMTALPRCGGPHIFSLRAMGPGGSFLCTWAIILGYVSAVCFEACAVPTIITYVCKNGDISPETIVNESPFDGFDWAGVFGQDLSSVGKYVNMLHTSIVA